MIKTSAIRADTREPFLSGSHYLRSLAARATAQNVLFNIGRAESDLGPLTAGVLAAHYSSHTVIAMLASTSIIDIIATVFLIPELKGKELE